MSVPEATANTRQANLNRQCFCVTLDKEALFRALELEIGDPEFSASNIKTRPHLFSNVSVFLSAAELVQMQEVVTAIETVATMPEYRSTALSWAPGIAQFDPGPVGALMGYDFHLGIDGPKLIEVNTNAGGAFLNAFLARAQTACCPQVQSEISVAKARGFEVAVLQMFEAEWQRQRGHGKPSRIAIIDDAPSDQYLYPEFALAQRLFQRHGIDAVIADPKDLKYTGDHLLSGVQPIDLVYNRLVDFSLGRPEHEALRSAYLAGAIVLTPNPRAHALLADKRNLTLLGNADRLRGWGLNEKTIAVLASGIPHTVLVTLEALDELWKERRRLFFKPTGGYGGKGAYRGDKLTKGVWEEIAKGGYIAQAFAPPGERAIKVDGAPVQLKTDVRLYTYAGNVLLAAARLYQGQTTNFRTAGGGFAPVFQV